MRPACFALAEISHYERAIRNKGVAFITPDVYFRLPLLGDDRICPGEGLPAVQNLICDDAVRAVVRRINADPAVRTVRFNEILWRIRQ